jgi:hypothetical protein
VTISTLGGGMLLVTWTETVGAVAEPWAMMLIGFAGLGFSGNRASRSAVVA